MTFSLLAASLIASLPAEPAPIEPIVEIKDVTPHAELFRGGRATKPTLVRSETEAAKHFNEESLAKLKKQVDFKSQIVLVFAWRGSGQDRLTFDVAESFPEQVQFKWQPGRTRDLRPHAHVYALRSNVKWSVK